MFGPANRAEVDCCPGENVSEDVPSSLHQTGMSLPKMSPLSSGSMEVVDIESRFACRVVVENERRTAALTKLKTRSVGHFILSKRLP